MKFTTFNDLRERPALECLRANNSIDVETILEDVGNLKWATALIMGAIRIRNKIQLPDLLFYVGLVISTCLARKEVITCSYDQIRRAEFRGPSVIA